MLHFKGNEDYITFSNAFPGNPWLTYWVIESWQEFEKMAFNSNQTYLILFQQWTRTGEILAYLGASFPTVYPCRPLLVLVVQDLLVIILSKN